MWKTILTHTGHTQCISTQINIYIFLSKFLLYPLLLAIILININLYFSNINLLNHVINKNKKYILNKNKNKFN